MNNPNLIRIGKYLVDKYGSRKFLVAVGAFTIVILAGTGLGQFPVEVVDGAMATIAGYLGVQGAIDHKTS